VPVRNILVRDSGSHVEHDDTALAVDVVAISKTTKLFLAGSIPNIELDGTQILWIMSVCFSQNDRHLEHS
jgi:hypothetical protein